MRQSPLPSEQKCWNRNLQVTDSTSVLQRTRRNEWRAARCQRGPAVFGAAGILVPDR